MSENKRNHPPFTFGLTPVRIKDKSVDEPGASTGEANTPPESGLLSATIFSQDPFGSQEDREHFMDWEKSQPTILETISQASPERIQFMLRYLTWSHLRAREGFYAAVASFNKYAKLLPPQLLKLRPLESQLIAGQKELIEAQEKRLERMDQMLDSFFHHRQQQEQILKSGRSRGTLARQAAAKGKREALVRAIAELFDKPDKPGWRWTNEQITDYLVH